MLKNSNVPKAGIEPAHLTVHDFESIVAVNLNSAVFNVFGLLLYKNRYRNTRLSTNILSVSVTFCHFLPMLAITMKHI